MILGRISKKEKEQKKNRNEHLNSKFNETYKYKYL